MAPQMVDHSQGKWRAGGIVFEKLTPRVKENFKLVCFPSLALLKRLERFIPWWLENRVVLLMERFSC